MTGCSAVLTPINSFLQVNYWSYPSTFTRASLSIVANPLTGDSDICPSTNSLSVDRQILVPGAARLKMFFIMIGMSYCITGTIVRGCKTLAPKYDCKKVRNFILENALTALINFRNHTESRHHHFPCLLIR